MKKILIVEDDELLLDALTGQLSQAGYSVCSAKRWKHAAQELEKQPVDGIILDLGLLGGDGLNLLKWTRERFAGLPVLILTARDGVEDRVKGLHAGADDYMTKPFNMAELQARLHSMLRRACLPAYQSAAVSGNQTVIGTLRLDHPRQEARLQDETLDLTRREWELLELLVNRCGEVVTREDVLASWRSLPLELGQASSHSSSNALEVYVHRLRKKLDSSDLKIRNIRGLGYMLEKPAA